MNRIKGKWRWNARCKFPGMTREQYDANMRAVKSLCHPILRRLPDLLSNGLTNMSLLSAVRRSGLAGIGKPRMTEMYRPVERPKTQAGEMARRVRQMAARAPQ